MIEKPYERIGCYIGKDGKWWMCRVVHSLHDRDQAVELYTENMRKIPQLEKWRYGFPSDMNDTSTFNTLISEELKND